MASTRRKILMFGGAAAAVTIAGGWRALTTPELSRASAPWLAAGDRFSDPRLNALSYAILAPNPHNMQPWQFALVDENSIDVYCDLQRRLPHTDPFDRQITIGFGCMLELLRQAAAEQGYTAQISMFPDGAGQPRLNQGRVARVAFVADSPERDRLFANVVSRRSTKETFLDKPVEAEALGALETAMIEPVKFGRTQSEQQLEVVSANAWAAWQVEQQTDATRRESIELMRFGNEAVVAQPDGIDMGGAFLSAGHAAGVLTPETLDTPGSYAYDSGFEMYQAMVDSTKHWVWLTTPGNSREEQLQAGAAWVRLNLAAQAQGLAVHPWSHSLQEFPEMEELNRELRGLLAPDGETIQMFARLGYGPEVPASPRWPLEAKLVDA